MQNFTKISSLCLVLISMIASNSYAAERLGPCNPKSPSGRGMDGSDCNPGLICDPVARICSNTTEVPCNIEVPCGIGMRCVNDEGRAVAQKTWGTCQPAASSAENNALSDVLCNTYKVATGKVGRGIVVIAIFVTGISFYVGKISWGTLLAILIGAGFCFGGPAIVSILLGRSFMC